MLTIELIVSCRMDIEENHPVRRTMKVKSLPTTININPHNNKILRYQHNIITTIKKEKQEKGILIYQKKHIVRRIHPKTPI